MTLRVEDRLAILDLAARLNEAASRRDVEGCTPLMIASPLLALDLPLKVLVWQSTDEQVWVSSNSVDYLRDRYAIPRELAGTLVVVDAVIQQALQS